MISSRGRFWLAAILACACVWSGVAKAVLVITHDQGGVVGDYVHRFMAQGPERTLGLCESACTIALDYPTTCVTPTSRFGFHAASAPDGTQWLWGHYPRNIRSMIVRHGGLNNAMWFASGRELISYGVPKCRTL